MDHSDEAGSPGRERLGGRVAIVTGAAQGLGQSVARRLAAEGAIVIAADVKVGPEGAAAGEPPSGRGRTMALELDVASPESWNAALAVVEREFGRLDILVNNAGIQRLGLAGDLPVDEFDQVMSVNVRGTFLGCQLVLPMMRRSPAGSIVNMSSIAGSISFMSGLAAYSTSKGAIQALTRAVAMDYAPDNIRVNSVSPGCVDTPLTRPFLEDPATSKLAIGRTPLDRPADAGEIAAAVAFLCSDDASYVTATDLRVDGGWAAS